MTLEDKSPALNKPLFLEGQLQDYAWGMGESSLVSKFSKQRSESGHYAELWFGSHPKAPSLLPEHGTDMLSLLKTSSADILGQSCLLHYGEQLPFLFKILSVGDALSIQAHPDKELAVKLHADDPAHYPDANPKPEMGLALSDLELLYGFRGKDEILGFLGEENGIPELRAFFTPEELEKLSALPEEAFLKEAYARVMQAEEALVSELSLQLFERLHKKSDRSPEEDWALKLEETYPQGDRGIFSFFLLQYLQVPSGKALFIGPNIAHAYLSGEMIECMAPSDNVVRAGLTYKFCDTEQLLSMLEYKKAKPELLSPADEGDILQFQTELGEYFQLSQLAKQESLVLKNAGPSLLFCLEGELPCLSQEDLPALQAGQAWLISDGLEVQVNTSEANAYLVRVPGL